MILAILLTAQLLSQAALVELDFSSMGSGDWSGKRFSEFVPARTITRIVRVTESDFARDAGRSGEQVVFDGLLAHLLDSTTVATDWALGGNEGRLADLLVIIKEGEILCIEVIGTPATPSSPTAILVHGKGRGVRIKSEPPDLLKEAHGPGHGLVGPLCILFGRPDEHLVDAACVGALSGDEVVRRDAVAG